MFLTGCGNTTQVNEMSESISNQAVNSSVTEENAKVVELTAEEEYAVQVVNKLLDKVTDPSSVKIYSVKGTSDIKTACGNAQYEILKSVNMEYIVKLDLSYYVSETNSTERFKNAWGYVGVDVGYSKDCVNDFMAGLAADTVKYEELNLDAILENSDYYKYVDK